MNKVKRLKITEKQATSLGLNKILEIEMDNTVVGDLLIVEFEEKYLLVNKNNSVIEAVIGPSNFIKSRQDLCNKAQSTYNELFETNKLSEAIYNGGGRTIGSLSSCVAMNERKNMVKEGVKKLVKISKNQYNRIFANGIINEAEGVKGGVDRVDKAFKKTFPVSNKIQDLDSVTEDNFNIKKHNTSVPKLPKDVGHVEKPIVENSELENIISKYVKNPDDIDTEMSRYYDMGYNGLSIPLRAQLSRDMDFISFTQKGHDDDTMKREIGESKSDGNIKKETNNLIKYFYRKSDDLSPFWGENGLSYDELCKHLVSKDLLISNNGKYELSKKLGTPEEAKQALENELKLLLGGDNSQKPELETEASNYPPGTERDQNAPWNQPDDDVTEPITPKEHNLDVVAYNRELAILKSPDGDLYAFYYWDVDKSEFMRYASLTRRYMGRDEDGEPTYEYDEEFDIDDGVISNYVNDNLKILSKGEGLSAYETDDFDLVRIDEPLKNELLNLYDKDKNINTILGSIKEVEFPEAWSGLKSDLKKATTKTTPTNKADDRQDKILSKLLDLKAKEKERREKESEVDELDEITSASSSGSFVAPMGTDVVKKKIKDVPVVAETDVADAGNFQYDAPGGLTLDLKSKGKTKAEKTPQWAGGSFVKQPECSKLNNNKEAQKGGCNQGATSLKLINPKGSINAPSLGEGVVSEALKLQHDKSNNKLIVISDLEGRPAFQETFNNKNVLKKNGFNWSGKNWVISSDKLDVAKRTLTLINKAEYLIDKLEEVEEAIMDAGFDNKDLLKSKLDQYIMDLANATDEVALSAEIRRYLTFFSKFHNYSFYNRMLIYIQNPDATRVGSYKTWQSRFRQVNKGAKAINVLAPIISKIKSTDGEEDELTSTSDVKGFRAVNVFDISDTKPIDERGEVPASPQWWGDNEPSETADKLFNAVKEVATHMGIEVTQDVAKGGEKGFSSGDHINLSSDVSGVARLSTMIHEIAHELMHWKKSSIYYIDNSIGGNLRQLQELQAESVSYVVLKHYGLPVSHHTTYLALWKANKEKIQKNLEIISKVSEFIIKKIDEQVNTD
jgi:hypothetical protein